MANRVVFDLNKAKRAIGFAAKVMEVEHVERKLPPCGHCGKRKLYVHTEYVQVGFFQTDFMLVCWCGLCARPTIIVHVDEGGSSE